MARVILDAGHGESDPGATYGGRQEKDDTLRLALAVGQILEKQGQEVVYTRTEDVYQTPFQKATIANEADADYFMSIHRNSSPVANEYNGVQSLVYQDIGLPAQIAREVNHNLEAIGFQNLGVEEKPRLVALRRTRMPAVIIQGGYINSDSDNTMFDGNFDAMAEAIANGFLQATSENGQNDMAAGQGTEAQQVDMPQESRFPIYRVQTGAYRQRENAEHLLYQLQQQGLPAFVAFDDGLYKVQVGAFGVLDNAVRMEAVLRRLGYNTYITS